MVIYFPRSLYSCLSLSSRHILKIIWATLLQTAGFTASPA